jgi:hypothetical protein
VPTIARSLLIAALALSGSWAAAQTVYRCGNSYGTQPCAGGTVVDTADPRTGADAARATKVGAEDAKRADAMEKARLATEKNAPKALVIGPKEPPPKPPAHAGEHGKDKKKAKGKPQDPELYTATAPGEGKKASKGK